ncbi:MAG: signal peptide peptidase SppA [Bacteriovoracia bacterium]
MSPLALVLILSGVFFMIFLAIAGAMFFFGGPGDWEDGKESRTAIFDGNSGAVGVIELSGVIMESKKLTKQIRKFEKSDRIKAVVIRVDSPGGAVGPSQEIYEAVKKLNAKKPVVASMGSVAASGGFYVAMAARKIFSNPGTITGSIGVIMEFANLQRLYEWAKIQRFAIKTGKFKDGGASYREMTAEERALFQGMLDNVLAQFKRAVAEGRKLPLEKITPIADGRIFSGEQAKELKLVDQLGTLQDAIAEAGKLADIKGEPRVVYPREHRRDRLLEFLLDQPDEEDSRARAGGLVERLADQVLARLGLGELDGGGARRAPGIYWLWNGAR